MTPASWRVKVCSLVFVVSLVAGGVLAARRLGPEVSPTRLAECRFAWTLTESQRVDRALDALGTDPRAGLPRGHLPLLLAAVRTHVPEDAWVVMVSKDEEHRLLTHTVLCAVAFPRRFLLLDSLDAGWQAKLASFGHDQYVLEYSTPHLPELEAACDPVVSGDFFALWRLRRGPR